MPERGNTMRGIGPVRVNGTTVYGYYMLDSNAVRLRVSVDEAEGLSLVAGLRIRLTLPGQDARDLLVTAANQNPPYVWLNLEPVARSEGRTRS